MLYWRFKLEGIVLLKLGMMFSWSLGNLSCVFGVVMCVWYDLIKEEKIIIKVLVMKNWNVVIEKIKWVVIER